MKGITTRNIVDMTPADAIRQAWLVSGRTQEEIEAAAGLRPGILDQYASRHDHHWPNLLHIPALCQAMGNDLLIDWQRAQVQAHALRHNTPAMTNADLLRQTLAAGGDFGDVARAVEDALADDNLTRRERMRIRREVQELVARLLRMVDSVSRGL